MRVLISAFAIALSLPAAPIVAAEPTLADALNVIRSKRFVDLTHSFSRPRRCGAAL